MKKKTSELKYAIWDELNGEFFPDIYFDKETMENHIRADQAYGSENANSLIIYELVPSRLKVSSKIHIEEE